MKMVIDIDDEQVLFDIKNRGLEAETETDKVIINALYNGTPLPEHHGRLISEEDMLSVILFSKLFDDAKVGEVKEALRNIPTIIEGSDSK